MTTEEFRAKYLLPQPIISTGIHPEFVKPADNIKADPAIDWRTKNVVSNVKDQAQCGRYFKNLPSIVSDILSCWAFSVTETIESAWMLAKKVKNTTFAPLAPQQMYDSKYASVIS